MVLCNSQREEGLVPSQICRTSNRVIPKNYKINLEPIFNFLRLFYWIIVEKTSMSRSAGKTFFHFSASCTEVIFCNVTSGQIGQKLHSRKRSEWASSHHRKMMFKGDWGCCPNKRICKNREPVQVYTACQFVKGQNMALIYFQLGNNSTMPPVVNSSTSRNALCPYLNLCPTWVQVKLRVLMIGPVPKSGTSQRAGTVPLANLARSNFVPVWHEVRTDNWQI